MDVLVYGAELAVGTIPRNLLGSPAADKSVQCPAQASMKMPGALSSKLCPGLVFPTEEGRKLGMMRRERG